MAVQVEYRYGTTAEHATFSGGANEITVDTTKRTTVVHDGITDGGFPTAREDLSNVHEFVGATPSTAGITGKLPIPAAGEESHLLSGNGSWVPAPRETVLVVSETGNRILSLGDFNAYIRFTQVAAKTLTIPTNDTVAFPIGTTVSGISFDGQLTFVAASGVTINTPETLLMRNATGVSFVITKVGTNEWDLAGDLEAA